MAVVTINKLRSGKWFWSTSLTGHPDYVRVGITDREGQAWRRAHKATTGLALDAHARKLEKQDFTLGEYAAMQEILNPPR